MFVNFIAPRRHGCPSSMNPFRLLQVLKLPDRLRDPQPHLLAVHVSGSGTASGEETWPCGDCCAIINPEYPAITPGENNYFI